MKKISGMGMLMRMDRYIQWPAMLAVAAVLAGCGTMRSSVVVEPAAGVRYDQAGGAAATPARTPIPGGSYVVNKGDTLYSIAFRKGVDFRDLAQWNDIDAPYTIWPGQRLTLSPSSKPAAGNASSSGTTTVAKTPEAPVFQPVEPVSTASSPTSSTAAATAGSSTAATVAKPVVALPEKPAVPAASSTAATVVPVAGVPAPATVPPPAPAAPVASGSARVVSGVSWRWPADGSLVGRFNSGDAIPGIEIAGKSGDPVRAAADGVVVYSGSGLVGYGELVIIKHNDSFLSAYGHNRKRLVKEGQKVSAGQQIAEMGSTGTTRNELEFQIRKDGSPVDPLGYLPSR